MQLIRKNLTGIISDGDPKKRISYKSENLNKRNYKKCYEKESIIVKEDMLAVEALSLMNIRKITVLCVYKNNK